MNTECIVYVKTLFPRYSIKKGLKTRTNPVTRNISKVQTGVSKYYFLIKSSRLLALKWLISVQRQEMDMWSVENLLIQEIKKVIKDHLAFS